MKRRLLFPLLALSSSLALVACGDKEPDEDDGDGSIDTDTDGTDTDTDTDGTDTDTDTDGTDTDTDTTAPVDSDGDGYDSTEDCDDANPDVNPGADEVCNGMDDDCDGDVDDADSDVDTSTGATFFLDDDGDGYGDEYSTIEACDRPDGYSDRSDDCDDANAAVNPGATEICNDIDDDCDSEIDVGAADMADWYADGDGDGFGDDADAVSACEAPDGYVADGGDCNDLDEWTWPGAEELCDGADNDCDSGTGERGLATWWDGRTGRPTDVTDDLGGTSSRPGSLSLDDDGTLSICEGTWYTNLSIGADVTVRGEGGDATDVVLDGADSDTVVRIDGDSLDVTLADLTITGGAGSESSGIGLGVAGGVHCEDVSSFATSLSVRDSIIERNTSTGIGGGLQAIGCDAQLSGVELAYNDAETGGGGAFSYYGGLSVDDTEVYGNSTDADVGGLFLFGDGSTEFVLEDVDVYDNVAIEWVGGVAIVAGALSWTGSTSGASGATRNEDAGYGAALYLEDAEAEIDGVDFGEPGTSDDNAPFDIYVHALGAQYNAGDDATFSCDSGDGCGDVDDFTVNSTDYTWTSVDSFLGVAYMADSEDTLVGFESFGSADSSCTADFFVLGRDTAPGSSAAYDYDIEWAGYGYDVPTADAWFGPDADIFMVAEEGRSYVAGFICDCADGDYCYTYATPSGTTGADMGLGDTTGFVFGDWSGTGEDAYFYPLSEGLGELFYQRFQVTSL
ncbi:MAG: hypothetical protein H6742_00820 [Alphaproteobacteria bacterium]|nr:hypothetical protein [Alphaproteobacteria bacterium]